MANSLTPFEGKEVIAVGVEMPSAAGGLREALKVDPVELEQGDDGYVVLHFETDKVRFEPIDKDNKGGPQRRVHILSVDTAALIDADLVAEHLAAQKERIRKAKEEEAGQTSLLDGEGEVTDLPLAGEPLGDTGTE